MVTYRHTELLRISDPKNLRFKTALASYSLLLHTIVGLVQKEFKNLKHFCSAYLCHDKINSHGEKSFGPMNMLHAR